MADLRFVLAAAVFFALIGVAVFFTLPAAIGVFRLFRKSQVSLGEYLVLFLALNLAIGLTTLAASRVVWNDDSGEKQSLPAVWIWAIALIAGLLVAWGGCVGLFIAHQLGVEEPRRRYRLLLQSLLLFPAYLTLLLAVMGTIFLSLDASWGGKLGLVGLWAAAVAGIVLVLRLHPLFETARRIERDRRRQADAARRAGAAAPPDRDAEERGPC